MDVAHVAAGVRWLSAIPDSLIAVLFAPVCVSCGKVLDTPLRSPVCSGCWRNIHRDTPPLCDSCGVPLAGSTRAHSCALGGTAITAACALGPFEGVLRDLVHAIKFDHRRSLVRSLARSGFADAVLHGADAIVAVPLHPWRYWTRGFNQADDLARAIATPALPVIPALRRVRPTRPQSLLAGEARRGNVQGAFRIAGWTTRQRRSWEQRISGRTLVLVDDVITTGATIEEAAAVLMRAGAREVRAVALARVARRAI